MTIQVIPHIIKGYDDDMAIFTVTETDPTVFKVELVETLFTVESWRELSEAIEKAFQMFKEADKP